MLHVTDFPFNAWGFEILELIFIYLFIFYVLVVINDKNIENSIKLYLIHFFIK